MNLTINDKTVDLATLSIEELETLARENQEDFHVMSRICSELSVRQLNRTVLEEGE